VNKLQLFLAVILIIIHVSSLSAQDFQDEIVLADSDDIFLNSVVEEVGPRVFGKYNYAFSLKTYPSERALLTANSGRVDGDAYRVFDFQEKSEGRYPNLVRVDVPYISIFFTAFVKDNDIRITGWEDMSNYRVAVIRGNKTMQARVNEFVPHESQAVVNSYEQAFDMLQVDRVDIVVGKPIVGVNYLEEHNLYMTGEFQFQDIYIYLHKKHEQLIPQIEMELQQMKESGELEYIENMVRDRLMN